MHNGIDPNAKKTTGAKRKAKEPLVAPSSKKLRPKPRARKTVQ